MKILFISDEIPCSNNNPCSNGGTCIGTLLSYQCVCPNGYTGTICESKQWWCTWITILIKSPGPVCSRQSDSHFSQNILNFIIVISLYTILVPQVSWLKYFIIMIPWRCNSSGNYILFHDQQKCMERILSWEVLLISMILYEKFMRKNSQLFQMKFHAEVITLVAMEELVMEPCWTISVPVE